MPKQIAGVDLKWWILGGSGAAIAVWWAVKRQQAKAAATTDTTDTTGYDSGFSPVQGVTPSLYGYTDPSTGTFIPNVGGGGTVVTAPTTNAQWAQQASSYLVNVLGYDSITVATAFGKWFGNINLTNDEYAIVQAAMTYEGKPPQPYPEPHVAPPAGQNPATSSKYSTVQAGWHVDQWITDVKAGKAGFPDPDFGWTKFITMNPQATANINWRSSVTHNSADNTFKARATYRVL
jgi:hypothetical protein